MKVSAIIPAAGLGVRLGEEKQFKLLAGYPLFIHSIRTFLNFPKIDRGYEMKTQSAVKTLSEARQIIDERYQEFSVEEDIEDSDQLETLLDNVDYDIEKPITVALEEFIEEELNWKKSDEECDEKSDS